MRFRRLIFNGLVVGLCLLLPGCMGCVGPKAKSDARNQLEDVRDQLASSYKKLGVVDRETVAQAQSAHEDLRVVHQLADSMVSVRDMVEDTGVYVMTDPDHPSRALLFSTKTSGDDRAMVCEFVDFEEGGKLQQVRATENGFPYQGEALYRKCLEKMVRHRLQLAFDRLTGRFPGRGPVDLDTAEKQLEPLEMSDAWADFHIDQELPIDFVDRPGRTVRFRITGQAEQGRSYEIVSFSTGQTWKLCSGCGDDGTDTDAW